ncbi:MAG: hypothetical protein KKB25_04050, partial [Nanoarchaeota archaeon]|nr:hypothetical protein [Nanoarchaeota archaeon]
MNKKIIILLAIILIAILAIAVIAIKQKRAAQIPAPDASENPCDSAPAEYKAQCEQANAWLDEKLVEWKPAEKGLLKFNGHLIFSSENMVDISDSKTDSIFFDIINDLNTDTISLFIYPDMFEKHKQRYEDLISKVRAANKELYAAYMVGEESNYNFEQHKKTELEFTKMFIEKYRPEYYVVVDEYTTLNKRAKMNASENEWKGLVVETANLVKNISPETKTVATGHSQELNFLRNMADIASIDLIGFNVWGIKQIDDKTPIGREIKEAVVYAKSKNKGVVFEQTWSLLHDAPRAKEISNYEFMKELDAKFVKVLAYYSNLLNVDIYSPFYTGKFVYYGSDQNEFVSALNNKQRTPAFEEYKSVIEEIRNKKQ